MRRRLLVAVAAAAILFGGSPSSRAAAPPAAVVVAQHYQYIPGQSDGVVPYKGEVVIAKGGDLTLANLDESAPHTLTGPPQPDGSYLFDTPQEVNQFSMAQVQGVAALAPGRYPFFCKLHTNLMSGMLVVE